MPIILQWQYQFEIAIKSICCKNTTLHTVQNSASNRKYSMKSTDAKCQRLTRNGSRFDIISGNVVAEMTHTERQKIVVEAFKTVLDKEYTMCYSFGKFTKENYGENTKKVQREKTTDRARDSAMSVHNAGSVDRCGSTRGRLPANAPCGSRPVVPSHPGRVGAVAKTRHHGDTD